MLSDSIPSLSASSTAALSTRSLLSGIRGSGWTGCGAMLDKLTVYV